MVRGIFKWRVLITKRIGGACLLRDVCEYGRLSGDAIQMVYIKKKRSRFQFDSMELGIQSKATFPCTKTKFVSKNAL